MCSQPDLSEAVEVAEFRLDLLVRGTMARHGQVLPELLDERRYVLQPPLTSADLEGLHECSGERGQLYGRRGVVRHTRFVPSNRDWFVPTTVNLRRRPGIPHPVV